MSYLVGNPENRFSRVATHFDFRDNCFCLKYIVSVHLSRVIRKQNNVVIEQVRQKPSCTSTERSLETEKFVFRKSRNSIIRVSKTNAPIICAFVFARMRNICSHDAAHFCSIIYAGGISFDCATISLQCGHIVQNTFIYLLSSCN